MTLGRNKAMDALEAEIIGGSAQAQHLRAMIQRVARSNASVLICGPSGSGKELVARAVHQLGARSEKAFSAINCGAIPSELIESELFGHEKGSFTGATARRIGHFEASDGGTIFLDEIGDMRFEMQVKLLRVLEDRTIVRVGSSDMRPVDVRVISATHQNLDNAIAEGRFREDLFFRLGVIVLQVPSLASRVSDIPALIRHFQSGMAADEKCRFDDGAMAVLMQHSWPGNVRELRNFVDRASVLHGGEILSAQDAAMLINPTAIFAPIGNPMQPAAMDVHEPIDLGAVRAAAEAAGNTRIMQDLANHSFDPAMMAQAAFPNKPALGKPIDLKREMETLELEQIHAALELADGIISEAARLLTLKRTTLIEKMRKYGVQLQAA
jgi:sigma-54 specific flagellar transcriptional regulator A